MRGGLERWKRGSDSRGVRHAIAYAFEGSCDAHLQPSKGADALQHYSDSERLPVTRYVVERGEITRDELSPGALRVWLSGHNPETGEERGKSLMRPDADLLLDGTLNHPKSFSIAALLHEELAAEFEALQDRLRDRIILAWQCELNARRGHSGLIRESIARIEVVELQHRRSRALDPHAHRHLWLNVKVQGEDGKWTNVDSRVAMKFHTVVNAEGELAARTDPEWVAALARHGYTIDAEGEVAELATAVRPFSRRSAQIEVNRARLVAEWSIAHSGAAPSIEVLAQIDRRAWAVSRPNKPADLDEGGWEAAIRAEISELDPTLTRPTPAVRLSPKRIESLDIDLLAAMAVVDADERSRGSSGRFSMFDLRAGAMRALARSGVTARREQLDAVIESILVRARRSVLTFSRDDDIPEHVKEYMAPDTARLKIRMTRQFEAVARPGRSLIPDELKRSGATIDGMDQSQIAAACAIAGAHGLVAVTGPAGAGKTTMLRAALTALTAQRRRMLIVAPTRKASSVASRETGAESSSLHGLLYDYGYRWAQDAAGAETWSRLAVGDIDPTTSSVYRGPTRVRVRAEDRIVVDEAGMVDLHTADALAQVCIETGAGLALVGDPYQALPVGHAGAMATAIRQTPAAVELDNVHRFQDPTYAALTLRLRQPRDHADALQVAAELSARGHVRRATNLEEAHATIADEYFGARRSGHRVAIVCGSNSEADAINSMIQQRRIEDGEIDPTSLVCGRNGQRLLVGDTVETRRNDHRTGVENRAQWIIERILPDIIHLRAPGGVERTGVSHSYALEYMQLAYASTVHGIQGETVDHCIVGPDVDAAGLYVGMTRGRSRNQLITIAHTEERATEQIAAAMLRGTAEITLADAQLAVDVEVRRAARRPAVHAPGPFVAAATSAGLSR